MKQVACPECGAPMWEGGRCPWTRDGVCRGRSFSMPTRPRRVQVMAAPKPRREPKPRGPRLPPGEARERRLARSAAYNAAHRQPVVATCVMCATTIPVHHGGPARKHCSPRCRGRYERRAA